jgi:hypothetical protein
MRTLAELVRSQGLLDKDEAALTTARSGNRYIDGTGARIYSGSLRRRGGVLYFIGRSGGGRYLFGVSAAPIQDDFPGTMGEESGLHYKRVELVPEAARVLHEYFPFTAPISLKDKRTTVGCGDRLGLATPGHIEAVKNHDAYPVLAQQSLRELSLTGRNYDGVVADASFGVFQEGFEKGYGADGDHLKRIEDMGVALRAGMPMITLDLSEVMNPAVADWSGETVEQEFAKLPESVRTIITERYGGKSFRVGDETIPIGEEEAKRCALMYVKALDFAKEVDDYLRNERGDAYDLEISIDETTTPTLPSHHVFIVSELTRRGITVTSLAPRFVGEFQKAIDYIGDLGEFERQFSTHCKIAQAYGGYKISVHSGSDKFSAYPAIGKHTGGRLHLKTAGTSWLQALRAIAQARPSLYRRIHEKAFQYYDEALKLYHITADPMRIPSLESVPDETLEETFFEQRDARQLLHITYGGLLNDPEIRGPFFQALDEEEALHIRKVAEHIERHVTLLGL